MNLSTYNIGEVMQSLLHDWLIQSNRGYAFIKRWEEQYGKNVHFKEGIKINELFYVNAGIEGMLTVGIRFKGGQEYPLLSFQITQYPSCCAMLQINGFSYHNTLDEGDVDKIMDLFTKTLRNRYSNRVKRFVFNFVEGQSGKRSQPYYFGDFPPVGETDEDRIQYRYLYKWAIKHHHQQMLFVNHNTGNIIHFVDCMVEQ